ncbi:MAG TPA: hypothetical protein VFL57_21265 [Bryobacteraceae bacterium]|nr:hypothetical protein [Bryobacteraceae bacterium]
MAAALGFAQRNTSFETRPDTLQPELRLWKVSVAALAGASALDVASSWGKCCEANTFLASPDRNFGARGLAIKSGTLSGQILLQYLLVRRNPKLSKVLGIINFTGAGAITGVAIRNYGIPQRR